MKMELGRIHGKFRIADINKQKRNIENYIRNVDSMVGGNVTYAAAYDKKIWDP